MTKVRTRIAPSPTGFLHLGTARTALFSWAYARHHGGDFILRIEDTDVARSNQESVDQIIAAMQWLNLGYDEGPFYQMQRIARYQEVIAQMLVAGTAYHCYCSTDELDAMRDRQRVAALPIRYDGTWRPEPGKTLPPVPADARPVVRFRSPQTGEVAWIDLVKGPISYNNQELDDLIIARAGQSGAEIGVPTYNFCVVVDDWDMGITHVIRGDDHVNNTPRQINILQALGAPLPQYGHTPMILGPDGDKLSKRHGAVSVLQYEDLGYLPEAMVNYLSRLGWSHGDDELFTPEQLVSWFDTDHLTKSAAQWDVKKLDWVNEHHIKQCAPDRLCLLVTAQLAKRGINADERLDAICALFKDRCATTVELATWASVYYAPVTIIDAERAQHVTADIKPALLLLATKLEAVEWSKPAIADAIKQVIAESAVKMPQLAMPARLLLSGRAQAPSLDALLALFSRNDALGRLRNH